MSKLFKPLNYIIYFLVIVIALSFVSKYDSRQKMLPISLWYVYSKSMEPILMTNDGFILISSKDYTTSDVITYKPKLLNQPYVTHRIVGISDDGDYITKGDNNSMSDQQGGEPLVTNEQVIGKALEFNNKLIVIPKLGITSNKIKTIIKELNAFTLLSIGLVIVLIEYIFDKLLNKRISTRRKHYKLIDIAPYFDYSFIILGVLIILNAFFIGITMKGWVNESFSYVVVSTEGLSSPMPGERFSRELSMENKTFISYITVLESDNSNMEINPKLLLLAPSACIDYNVTLYAPERLGYYTEKIYKRTYPRILPQKLFALLYSKNRYFPLLTTFIPGMLLVIGCYIWWSRRWQIVRREVMPWLIYLRNSLRSL